METEIWKETQFNWISISSVWRVKRVWELLNSKINSWYHYVYIRKNEWCLSDKWRWACISIHKLVSMSFIPNPENKPYVNHINGIKTDNRVENLEWVTAKENTIHAWKTWLCKASKNNHYITNHPCKWKFWSNSILAKSVDQFTMDWVYIKTHLCIREAAKEIWRNYKNITNCCRMWRKSCWWFIWRYHVEIF